MLFQVVAAGLGPGEGEKRQRAVVAACLGPGEREKRQRAGNAGRARHH